MTAQDVIVATIVVTCAAWAGWRLWRTLRPRSGAGCGCDRSGCDAAPRAPTARPR